MSKASFDSLNHTERETLIEQAGFLAKEAKNLHTAYPWLSNFIFGLKILDQSIADDIKARQQIPACAKGCNNCCTQPIPITPPEIMLIKIYLQHLKNRKILPAVLTDNKLADKQNDTLDIKKCNTACVHLTSDGCSIYPVRPIACRRYIVFNKTCTIGECVTETRPNDVLHPSRHALLNALRSTVPYYATIKLLPIKAAPNIEFFASSTIFMSTVNWQ